MLTSLSKPLFQPLSQPSTLLAALVTLLVGLAAIAVPATAQQGNPHLVDPARTATLEVVKHLGDPATQFGDPTNPLADLGREPVPGIVFEARLIDAIDLGTNAGWQELATLPAEAFVPGGPLAGRLGRSFTATTGADGVATFDQLPVGAYYVTETSWSAGEKGLSVAEPFIVTLPRTAADGTWAYHVRVNAKDQSIAAHKMADRTTAEVGDVIAMGISGDTPAPNRDEAITRYEIHDPLDPNLAFQEGSSRVFIGDTQGAVPRTELVDGTDFHVTVDGANVAALRLSDAGLATLAKLRRGNPGVQVTWHFKVKLTARPDDGIVRNRAFVLVEGYPPFDPGTRPGVPTNEVVIEVPTPPTSTPPTTTTPKTPGTPPTTPIPVPVPPQEPTIPVPAPPAPPAPETPATPPRGPLAQTGASVIGLVLLGIALILGGTILRRRGTGGSK